jgi:hypothetical protein
VTAPNFVRGFTAILTIAFKDLKTGMGTLGSAALIGLITIAAAGIALSQLRDTYGTDLDYVEPL